MFLFDKLIQFKANFYHKELNVYFALRDFTVLINILKNNFGAKWDIRKKKKLYLLLSSNFTCFCLGKLMNKSKNCHEESLCSF